MAKPCQIVESQALWGESHFTVWFPDDNLTRQVRSDELTPIGNTPILTADELTYRVAAARVTAEVEQNATLLAPLEASVLPLPHQVRALERATAGDGVRFLLADEVGLGKTIEAGLILRELKLRGLARRILVVVPKGLVRQWEAELLTHFGEQFRVIVGDELKALRAFNRDPSGAAGLRAKLPDLTVWRAFDQVICSVDAVKPIESRRGWSREQVAAYNRERFDDLIAAGWDLVIVDEAHRLAGSTDDVARYQLGQGLAGAAPYLLLLSATPHQGKSDAFRRLLGLLDAETFPDDQSVTRERIRPFVIRTEKRAAIDAQGQPLFQPRQTRLLPVTWTAKPQQVLYEAVTDYVRDGYNRAVREKRPYVGFLLLLMQRLVTSSTRAIRVALEQRYRALEQPAGVEPASNAPGDAWSDAGDDEQPEKLFAAFLAELANERTEVDQLLGLARAAERVGADAKAEALHDQILQVQRAEGDPDLKVLVFTEFVATQEMLRDFLTQRGFRVVCLNGDLEVEERRRVQQSFAREAQVLVSTDAGGEGLNLQFCHVVVNYDVPWNPMRLEQRIGRVDRIGQNHAVLALNLVLADTVEHRVQEVIERKLRVILAEFGVDKTGDVLDSADDGGTFEGLYRAAILAPNTLDAAASATLEQVQAEAREAQRTRWLLGEDPPLAPDAARSFLDHPLPGWVERMVVGYLRSHAGSAERTDHSWRLAWPTGEVTADVVFTAREAQADSRAQLVTLDDPRIRAILDAIPTWAPGQPLASVRLPQLPATVQGVWSLWKVMLRTHSDQRQRIIPLFVSDADRVFIPTALRIWEALLTDSFRLAGTTSLGSTPVAPTPALPAHGEGGGGGDPLWSRLRQHAEVRGQGVYAELVQEHRARLARDVAKGEYAFAARRRAIERVGLAAVRAYRLARLEEELAAWRAQLAERAETRPDLVPLVLARVAGGAEGV
jgi:superfamily II DNA or RNA helicase